MYVIYIIELTMKFLKKVGFILLEQLSEMAKTKQKYLHFQPDFFYLLEPKLVWASLVLLYRVLV